MFKGLPTKRRVYKSLESRGKAFDKLVKQGYNHFTLFTRKPKTDAAFFRTKDGRVCGRPELNDGTVWGIVCKRVSTYGRRGLFCQHVVQEVE
jgi:hypothetical protein